MKQILNACGNCCTVTTGHELVNLDARISLGSNRSPSIQNNNFIPMMFESIHTMQG